MKKITAKQYAQSLYSSIKEKHGAEATKSIQNFLMLVKKRKNLKLLDKIFKAFVEVYHEQEGLLKAEIVSHHHLTEKTRTEVLRWLKERTGRTASLNASVDEKILGGIIIKYGDTVIDASLRNKLAKMQAELSK